MNLNRPHQNNGNMEDQINSTIANMAALKNSGAFNSPQYLEQIHLLIDNVFDFIKESILKDVGENLNFNEQNFIIFYKKMIEFGTIAVVKDALNYESLVIFFDDFMVNLSYLYPRKKYPKPWLDFESALAAQVQIIHDVCEEASLIRFHAESLLNKSNTLHEN